MKEIVFQRWCDVCQRVEEKKVEAIFSSVISVSDVTREIDLCSDHRDKIVGDLPEHLTQYGRTPDALAAGDAPVQTSSRRRAPAGVDQHTCPVPTCRQFFAGTNSLSGHCRTVHGQTLTALRSQVSGVPPRSEAIDCDICGQTCGSPQGLGAHKRTKHGIEGTGASTLYNRTRQHQPALTGE